MLQQHRAMLQITIQRIRFLNIIFSLVYWSCIYLVWTFLTTVDQAKRGCRYTIRHKVREFSFSSRRWRARCLWSQSPGRHPDSPQATRSVSKGPPPNFSLFFYHSLPAFSPLLELLSIQANAARRKFHDTFQVSKEPGHLFIHGASFLWAYIPMRRFCVSLSI